MKKILIVILLLTAILSSSAQNTNSGYIFAPNFRILPSNVTAQYETDITRHATNPLLMFASASTINTLTSFRSEGVYVSTNGGMNWFGSDTIFAVPLFNHGGDPGPIIDFNNRFIFVHHGILINGIFAHYSTNMGANWTNAYTIATGDMDKGNDIVYDVSSSSPYFGRIYVSFVFLTPPFYVRYSYTSNSGESWSPGTIINNPPQRCQGAEIRTDLSGNVFVSWGSVINISPFTEDYIGFARSSNGGSSWTVNENAADINGIAGRLQQKGNVAVNGLPRMDVDMTNGPRSGWIYIITTERNLAPAGSDPDVILRKSTNGGVSFQPPVRVNQDAVNNGKTQFYPCIRIDEGGGVNIIYYDDRNTAIDSTEVFLSRSTDGGVTFTDYVISDHRFAPKSIAGAGAGFMGDKIGLTSGNNKLNAVWMSDITGIFQAWGCIIDLNEIGIKKLSNEIPINIELKQNYPNPFNPETNIEFSLPNSDLVNLSIYDINGKLISTILNQKVESGYYNYKFIAPPNLSSGIYFVTLKTLSERLTRSIVLMK
ncbi:MAG: T9SS type A sorting domain-containing protein [Ignavibacteria bacterium]|nr:T9SS type A sorting domain-containing protein [Ignavibacteria bacterium]